MKRTLTLIAVVVSFVAVPAYAFSPELRNEDSKSYNFEIECGGSTLQSSIGGHTTTSLGLSSVGCKLKIKGAGAAKLAKDMKCIIKDSMLDCS
jgi:hypothetical protein